MKMIRSLRNRLARPSSKTLLKILLTDRRVREKIIALNGQMAFGKKEGCDEKA
jgi:hypothetical protein